MSDIIKEAIKDGATVLDVRTPIEYIQKAFPGAVNIPLDQLHLMLDSLGPRDSAIVVYCASGMRSASAKKILTKAGFEKVIDAGGLDEMPKVII